MFCRWLTLVSVPVVKVGEMKLYWKRVAGLAVAMVLIAGACSDPEQASPDTSETAAPETTEPEPTTTTNPDVLPEFSEATRPTLEIPDSDSYKDDLEEIRERYLLYQEAFFYAGGPPVIDPDDPTLAGLMTGEKTENIRRHLTTLKEEGWVYVLPEDTIATSRISFVGTIGPKKEEGNTVFLKVCFVNDSKIVRLSDGHVGEEGVITQLLHVEMRFTDGEWKVAGTSDKKQYEGVSECPGEL